MRKLVLLLVLGLGAHLSQAQTASTKIGYADVDYIFSQLPESKAIEAELKSTQAQLKNQIDAKYAEFQKKLADYNANLNTMLDAVRTNYRARASANAAKHRKAASRCSNHHSNQANTINGSCLQKSR